MLLDDGIRISQDTIGNTIIVNGNINSNDDGIDIFDGASTRIVVNGNITNTDTGTGVGLRMSQNIDNHVIVTGNITNTESAQGIYIRDGSNNNNNNNTVTVNGNIAAGGVGVELYDSNNNDITVEGNISFGAAVGVKLLRSGSNIINLNGNVTTARDDAHSVFMEASDNNIVNLSGTVNATGPNSYAVLGDVDSDTATLNLLAGSQIIGAIDLGGAGDNDTANIYGGSTSANLTFENTGNINLFSVGVKEDNNVVTVDTTGESSRDVALSHHLIGAQPY